jgi:hypothetical protein
MMPARSKILGLLLWALLAIRPVSAQSVDGLNQQVPWVAAALSEFISDSRSFVARAELQLPAEEGRKALTLPFGVAMDDGRMRWDLRLADISPELVAAEFINPLKQAGWERIQMFYHPQAATRLVVPAEKAYVEFAQSTNGPSKLENDSALKLGKMEKKLIASETVDGHPCKKYRLTSKEGAQVEEAFLWEATDLQGLPIKLQVRSAGQLYGFQFRQIRMGKPDPKVFGIPADYRKANTAQELLAGAMLRSLGQGKSALSLP